MNRSGHEIWLVGWKHEILCSDLYDSVFVDQRQTCQGIISLAMSASVDCSPIDEICGVNR
jgi:hypothetical protein